MSKLTRYVQKVFGSSDSSQNFSQFGGFVANITTLYSGSAITPDLVQGLSNYLTGWTQAVIGNNAFAIEDFNSICYLFAYQLAYLFQAGIAEWDASTTYYTGSLVNSGGQVYRSLQDSNLNQAVTVGAYWGSPIVSGSITKAASAGSAEITSGQVLTNPNFTVSNGDTYTIDSGAFFLGVTSLKINGAMVVSGTSRIL